MRYYSQNLKKLKKELEKYGLTQKQVEAGVKYYVKFCNKLDIPPKKCARMVKNMIEKIRLGIEKVEKKSLHS